MKKLLLAAAAVLMALQLNGADSSWLTDFAAAQKKAKDEKKLILLDFTGSDWCPPCMKLKKDVLSTKEFLDYTKTNFVLVEVDFPRRKQLPADQQQANQALSQKYNIEAFPTIIVVKSDGKEVWRQMSYVPGGPKAWIAMLEDAKKKS